MWVSKRKWNAMENRMEKCEEMIQDCRKEMGILVQNTARKILEQPEELIEEIRGLEDIDRMVKKFINS